MGVVYGLYSTRDGQVRYVGQTEYTAKKRLDRWITDALEQKTGAVSDWIQDEWRADYEVRAWVLQSDIIPADLEMFEAHWIEQFDDLLNVRAPANPNREATDVGRRVNETIVANLRGDGA